MDSTTFCLPPGAMRVGWPSHLALFKRGRAEIPVRQSWGVVAAGGGLYCSGDGCLFAVPITSLALRNCCTSPLRGAICNRGDQLTSKILNSLTAPGPEAFRRTRGD